MVSVLILTKNEEQDLPGCLSSVGWCDDIHVFDSYSSDSTIEIAQLAGAKITQRNFDNWSAHQNWGLANIPFKYEWVLYIDADERISEELLNALKKIEFKITSSVAFNIRRRDFAWNGKWLKHTQISPFYLRLFKPVNMRYERLVNPVSLPDGPTGTIDGYIDHYPFSKGVRFWLQRHLSYADLEAAMYIENAKAATHFSFRKALFSNDFTEKRFHQKGLFFKLPGRPVIKWCYMVFIRLSFLDGRAGMTYSTLQAIYEYFIVLKTRELIRQQNSSKK
jgi:glycosyltransferase involved in cell wall biosynthesis